MTMQSWLTHLAWPFLPAWESARHYSGRKLGKDFQASLIVSALELPQAMAYAVVAGVPPEYGIYTSIIQGFFAALFSSSEHLASGPTNTHSLLIASAATRVAGADPAMYLQVVFGLSLLKGIIQLLFAAGGVGQMVRYVSRSVILGLMAGAGVLIGIGQLPAFLGLHNLPAGSPLPGVVGQLHDMLPHLDAINPKAVGIGMATLAITLGCRMISRQFPGAILAVVATAALVAIVGWSSGDLDLLGYRQGHLPGFHLPELSWEAYQQMFGGALALAILGMLESVAIVKAIAAQTHEKVNPNREFFAQGMSNVIAGFFMCFPGSGSFTRSALNHSAGGSTRFTSMIGAAVVALIFFCFASQARYIPLACLAGILLVIACDLIQWRTIARIATTSREDAIVCLATFLATLTVPLEYAIFIGVFLNIGLYVRRSSRLQLNQMVATGPDHSRFIERPVRDASGNEPVLFLQMEGDLFFGVADELEDRLTRVVQSPVRVVIFRLKRTSAIDSTVLHVLEQFIRQMQHRHAHVLLCGVKPELMQQFRAYGLVDLLGSKAVFEAGFDVFSSARKALEYARTLLDESIDMDAVPQAQEPDEWSSYSI